MGKSTEPPTCRFCGKAHRGTCMDHEARGAISSQLDISAVVARVAAMSPAEVIVASKERKKKLTAARKAAKKSTGGVAQFGRAATQAPKVVDVAGSSPVAPGGPNSSGGSSAVERRPSKPTVEGSTPSPRSKKSAASPKAKDRPLRGKALSRDSAIALSPSGPADRKRVSTTITDKVNGISHTSVHVPIPAAELANLYAGAIPKKRKPRMTQPTDKPAKSGRGRPKTVADRKAYKAEKEKERRARQKLAK